MGVVGGRPQDGGGGGDVHRMGVLGNVHRMGVVGKRPQDGGGGGTSTG